MYVTHVQHDELLNTPDRYREKRDQLLAVFSGVVQERVATESLVVGESTLGSAKLGSKLPTETMVWDLSRWGESKWGKEEGSLYDRILDALKKADSAPRKELSHMRDALIAETAIVNKLILVSTDRRLVAIVRSLGAQVFFVE